MNKEELIRYYANAFDVTLTDARTYIDSFAQLVEDVIAMGKTLNLTGVMQMGVKVPKPKKLYNFQTGKVQYTDPKPIPYVKFGKRLREAAASAPIAYREG